MASCAAPGNVAAEMASVAAAFAVSDPAAVAIGLLGPVEHQGTVADILGSRIVAAGIDSLGLVQLQKRSAADNHKVRARWTGAARPVVSSTYRARRRMDPSGTACRIVD